MKIDIKPTVIKANDYYKTILDAYGVESLFYFECENGWKYSVDFTADRLSEFLPNQTVSEFINGGQKSIERNYKFYKKGVDSFGKPDKHGFRKGKHPKWKSPIYDDNGKLIRFDPYPIYGIRTWEGGINQWRERLGKITFIEIKC